MRVTQARDHQVSELEPIRYCTVDEVRRQVLRVEIDVQESPLGALLSSASFNDLVETYLVGARHWVEAPEQAGHDFELHEDVEVYLSGHGESGLNLAPLGFVPLVEISGLTISGSAQVLNTDYVADSRGLLKQAWVSSSQRTLFTRGFQNITATLTWGYESYPEDIKLAQALKATADLLRFVERSDVENVPGGMTQIRYGSDLVINTGTQGRYSRAIKDLEEQARRICLRYQHVKAVLGAPY